MKRRIYPFLSYLRYWLIQEDQYALQSPSVYRIYTGLLQFMEQHKNADLDLEMLRKELLQDEEILQIEDFGAGSKKLKSAHRKTADITKYSTSGRKFSQVYQYFCLLSPSMHVLELGTCTGINSRYLSRVTKGSFYSFEGSAALWRKAQESKIENNSHYILGKIEDKLPDVLEKIKTVDFALVDATHTFKGTKQYFDLLLPCLKETSILAIADIHWSEEMSAIWKQLKHHPQVSLSLDFYETGILFFDPNLPKSSYVLSL